MYIRKDGAATSGGFEQPGPAQKIGWAITQSWGPPQFPYWPSKARYWVRAHWGRAIQRKIEAVTNYAIWGCECRLDHSPIEVMCRECGAVAPAYGNSGTGAIFGKPLSGYCEARLGDVVGICRVTDWLPPHDSQLRTLFEILARLLALEAAAGRADFNAINSTVIAVFDRVMDVTARWVVQHDRATALRWGLVKMQTDAPRMPGGAR